MSWIPIIPPDDADDKLASLYKKLSPKGAPLANILGISSVNPDLLEGHLALYRPLMFGRSTLKRQEREFLAVIVSRANDCFY